MFTDRGRSWARSEGGTRREKTTGSRTALPKLLVLDSARCGRLGRRRQLTPSLSPVAQGRGVPARHKSRLAWVASAVVVCEVLASA
jgi:hypothetical protein